MACPAKEKTLGKTMTVCWIQYGKHIKGSAVILSEQDKGQDPHDI